MKLRSQPASSNQAADAGIFLIVVALPLAFAPFSAVVFVDLKLVALAAGTLLVALSRPVVDPRAAVAAGAFSAALALATAAGADPRWSLLGPEQQGTGAVPLAAAAYLFCAGTGLVEDLRPRVGPWLFGAGIAVSAISVIGRFVAIGGETWELGPLASTIGNRVFVGGFAAAAAVASTTVRRRRRAYIGLVVIGSCLAVTAVRGAWIGAVLGFAIVILRRRDRRDVALLLLPLVVTILAWTAFDETQPEQEIGYSAASRFAELDEGSAQERPAVYRAYLRAWMNDPVLGTGPGTGWGAYLRHGTPEEIRRGGRGYADAHNIALELGTTTGVIGVATLAALVLVAAVGALRAPPERAWALGIAACLAVMHLLQPLNLVLTPLAFLCGGLAMRSSSSRGWRTPRWVAILAAVALALACVRLTASTFQRYGSFYASPAALHWSLRFEPLRLESSFLLAELRAFDHRTGDRRARAEVHRILDAVIAEHGWNPRVRPVAANIVLVMDEEERATELIDEQLRVYPNDTEALRAAAVLALRIDEPGRAASFARRLLEIDPDSESAQRLIRDADRARR